MKSDLPQDEYGRGSRLTAAAIALATAALAAAASFLTAPNFSLPVVFCLAIGIAAWVLAVSRRELRQQNATLEESNSELAAREEEIARQNEELVSQSEELERQTEELRLANDELASRERVLAQLLTLSRTLTSELTRDQVMLSICDALGDLLGDVAEAAALFLQQDDELELQCHAGFGADGPRQKTMPFGTSFAALVMARGQAGFLEDIEMRKDVMIVQPSGRPAFRSVLAAPLWSRGRAIGVVEVYNRHPTPWTEEQLNTTNSLAAQASLSLETATLFEELEREKRRFETVFRTLPVAVLFAEDASCARVSGNPAAAALFTAPLDANYSPYAPAGARLRRAILRAGRELGPEEQPLVRAAAGDEVAPEELELVFPNGRRIVVLVAATPFYDAEGNVSGAVSALADITPQKELERELENRRREAEEGSVRKTRFLAALSHDVRTPVNAIRLQAELIKRSADTPELANRIPELADKLHDNAIALVDLVGEVLDLTRFDTGKIELQATEFALADALAAECAQLRVAAENKGLRLVCDAIEPPIWMYTDRIKLERILGNLIDNAIKFTAAGTIRVHAHLERGGVEIAVHDPGAGIPLAEQASIFDEFYQLRNPERDRNKGRGLGLAICKRLAEAMGGTITVASMPGKGSTFTVRLPPTTVLARPGAAQTTVAVPRAEAREKERSLAGVHVLLVEDHPDTREATAALLSAAGAIVTEAADGHSALRMIREVQPHITLLDLMLPGLDGLQVLQSIASERPDALQSIVVLTGDSASRSIHEIGRLGAGMVITKPVDPDALLAHLRALFARLPSR